MRILFCLIALALPMYWGGNLYAQSNANVVGKSTHVTIMGTVVDDEGEPLPGASVRIKGSKATSGMTMTNANGVFGLKYDGKDKAPTLIITYLGMERTEVKATLGKKMHIVMNPDATQLSEVTVIDDGYNRLPRQDMVGAYTTVKAEDVLMPSYQSIDQMLQGKVAGLMVENSSARVGSSPKISIRGTSTLLGNTDPLWVVDGVIQPDPLTIDASDMLTDDLSNIIGNQISWLNPLDIETITVLKDASATAIYGSKASNGVIVITTKKGSADRLSVRYTGSVSIRERATYDNYNYMNSQERIAFSKEAYDAGARYNTEPVEQLYTYEGLMAMFNNRHITENQFAYYMEKLETVNTDWLKLLTRNSVSNSHNVSISGGNSKATYNASFGYSSNNGTEIGNDNDQFTSRLNVGIQFNKRLHASVNMAGSYRTSNGYAAGVNPQSYALSTSRAIPAYTEDGQLAYYNQRYEYALNSNQLEYGYNILNEMANTSSKGTSRNFQVSLNLDFKITDWLTYQFTGAVVQAVNSTESYAGEKSSYIECNYRGYPYGTAESGSDLFKAAMLPFGGQLANTNTTSTTYSMTNKLQFSKLFAEKHRVNALVGVELRSIEGQGNTNTVWGYVPERGELVVTPNRPQDIVPIGGARPIYWGALDGMFNGNAWKNYHRTDNYLSYFATAAYSFMNRYVINANVRQDASNRFGQDTNNKFNPTYSLGFSWRLAQEQFIQDNCPWLDQFNLSGTFGIQGNVVNSISPDLLAAYGGILGGYNEYYVTISSLPNPQLKWESTRTWNLGLQAQLFSKFTLDFSYYGRRSNAIISQDIADEYGMSTMRLNGGIIHNHGIELTVNYTPISNKDMAWTIGFNTSKNWNKSNNTRTVRANTITKDNYLTGNGGQPLREGYPLNSFWSYSFAGLNPTNGYPTFNYLDCDEYDSDVDPTTFLVYSGTTTPTFSGGLNTRFRYKDFSIGTSFAAILGAKKRLRNPYLNFNSGKIPDPYYNLQKTLNDRWKQPGDEAHTYIPALYTSADPVNEPFNLYTPDGIPTSRYSMWANSDIMVADASFLRCSQINATYYLPKKICGKFGAQSLSVSATLNNVFVIASKRWNGFDPELVDSTTPRVYSLGLNVSF